MEAITKALKMKLTSVVDNAIGTCGGYIWQLHADEACGTYMMCLHGVDKCVIYTR